PAVAEDDRLARAPVLVEDLRPIGRRDGTHGLPPLVSALPAKVPPGSVTIARRALPCHPATAAVNHAGTAPVWQSAVAVAPVQASLWPVPVMRSVTIRSPSVSS